MQLQAAVKYVFSRRADKIKGTGGHPGWLDVSRDTEWADEPHLFTMGAPLDAPEIVPAGGIAAAQMRNEWRDTWNVPVQILTTRA